MGKTGRKLTIRMPDSNRLSSAEVVALHVEPGGRAAVGAPVMTLRARRREHTLRAPRPGRVVSLVGPGDRVRGGDPLYVLNIDEAALAQQNSDARALIAIERARSATDADPERIQVLPRRRRASPGRLSRALGAWLGPLLALAFYVAASFAFLPVMGAISDASTGVGRAVLLVAAVLLGILIFRLYAPRFPGAPRTLVKLVAIAWVGIAAIAVLHRPTGPDDLTLGRAGERVAEMLWPREKPGAPPLAGPAAKPSAGPFAGPFAAPSAGPSELLAAAPPVAAPPVAESSGVYAGRPDAASPERADPRSRLPGTAAPTPDGHGVSVRAWGRQNPAMASGEPPRHAAPDAVSDAPAPPAEIAAAWPMPLGDAGPAGASPPAAPERVAGVPVPVSPPVAVAEALSPPAPGAGDELAPSADPAEDGALPDRIAPALAAGDPPGPLALAAPRDAGWLSRDVPVVADAGAPAPALPDSAPVAAPGDSAGAAAVSRTAGPARPRGAASPGPVMIAALRAGDSAWMDRTGDPSDETSAVSAAEPSPLAAAAGAAPAATLAPPAAPQAAGDLPARAEAPALPAARREIDESTVAMAPDDVAPAGPRNADTSVARGAAPGGQAVAMAPAATPVAPAAPEELAERRLLFLYYDDPRLETHPRVGDQWLPAVGPEAAGAIRSARVEKVVEVVEVVDWCTAEDPTAALSDRIRLLDVRLDIDPAGVAGLETALPVLTGAPPGLFHNQAPLLGGPGDAGLIDEARGFLGVAEQGAPDGRYFDSAPALARALAQAGCRRIEWNGGDGPANEIGRELSRRIAG